MERSSKRPAITIVLGMLLQCWACAFALNPALDVNQYAHTAWKISEEFSKGVISSIAQTPDGYLWLGTEFGLLRFDGVRTVPWSPPVRDKLPSSNITTLRAARDGSLWIGTSQGLARWKDSKLTHYPKLDGLIVEWLLEDREGTFWVVAGSRLSEARLCKIQGGTTQCYGENGGAGSRVTAIYEDRKGNLWAGAMDGVWQWKPGAPKLYRMAGPAQRTYALAESDDGGILIARRDGMTKLKNGKFEPYPLPAGLQFLPGRLLRDRDGGLWIGALADQGLLHIHQGKTDLFTPSDGISGDLSGPIVRCFFEDREGSIWASTSGGLDRFREFAVPTFSVQQGFSSRAVASVLAGKDGSIWLGTPDGLNRWNKGQVTIYRKRKVRGGVLAGGLTPGQAAEPGISIRQIFSTGLPHDELVSLFEDSDGNIWVAGLGGLAFLRAEDFVPVDSVPPGNVLSITGDREGNVWISHEEGLFHLRQALLVERIPWASLGHRQPASTLLGDAVHGGLWLGFRDGGVGFFKDGQLRATYAGAQGLGEGMVHRLYIDGDTTVWVSTASGLSRIKNGHVLTLTTQNGLPCDNVHWMMEDDVHSVWLYTACGLVRTARSELDAWVFHTKRTIQVTVFNASDGVKSHSAIDGSPLVTKARDGRLWFSNSEGVSVVDPHHIAVNQLPPPVHIEQISADDKNYEAENGMKLPPSIRYLSFDYTALSLVTPEKVRFRYKLEGLDEDWREVGNVRRVEYTNLPPKHYKFRVLACNNSGVWNEEGATLEFVIPPMWYQTSWFRSLCAAVFLAFIWMLHQLRLRQQARQFNRTLEARVSERTRIARDLHDTLLQSFHGLLLQFQATSQLLQPNSPVKQRLDTAIDQAAKAIADSRKTVQGLRTSAMEGRDLGKAIRTVGEELASANAGGEAIAFQVQGVGPQRDLRALVHDEVYRIAVEALRNAFQHASAKSVTVEIHYEPREFRLRISDDGRGIDAQVLQGEGVKGHFGLPGMRERATIIGGKLDVWSSVGEGTEINLTIPGAKAYSGVDERPWWSGKLLRKEKDHSKAAKTTQ